jgi:hypothetical protein
VRHQETVGSLRVAHRHKPESIKDALSGKDTARISDIFQDRWLDSTA